MNGKSLQMSQHLRATIYLVVATNHKQPFTNGSTNPHLSLTTRGCGDYWLIFRSVLLSHNFAQCRMRQQFASSLKCMSTLKGTSHIFPYFHSFGDTSCLSLEFSGTTQHSSCGVQSTNNVDIFKKLQLCLLQQIMTQKPVLFCFFRAKLHLLNIVSMWHIERQGLNLVERK